VGALALVLMFPLGLVASATLVWAGTPRFGRPVAIVWGRPTLTNNIRPEWRVIWTNRPSPPPPIPAKPTR
jgi:hypothetical protein